MSYRLHYVVFVSSLPWLLKYFTNSRLGWKQRPNFPYGSQDQKSIEEKIIIIITIKSELCITTLTQFR